VFYLQSGLNLSRAWELSAYYQEMTLPPNVVFNYSFVGLLDQNTTNPRNLAMPENYINWTNHPFVRGLGTIRHATSFAWIFTYVVKCTTARWIWRGDDDILINFELLPQYARLLDHMYDPLRDVVVKGDCIKNGPIYPQGGAGVLMSRRAVELLEPWGNYFIWGFFEDVPDKRFGVILEKIMSDVGMITSSAFLGCRLSESDFSKLRRQNFSDLAPCPDVPTGQGGRGCRPIAAPTHQIVFFHVGSVFENGPGFLRDRLGFARILWTASSDIAFHVTGGYQKGLCRILPDHVASVIP
jgi:hypothetical protein